jgi:mercuric ion transport protein
MAESKAVSSGIISGLLAAFGASLCCVGPLVLLMMGISGAWISKLTILEPYQPIFIILVFVLFGLSGWKLYKPKQDCKESDVCAIPRVKVRRKILFWCLFAIAMVLSTSKYWLFYILS